MSNILITKKNYKSLKSSFKIVLPLLVFCFFVTSIAFGEVSIQVSSSGSILPNLVKNSGDKNSLEGWRGLPGITLKNTENDGIRVSGTQDGKWNYALIDLLDPNIEPGATYRIEAWMKVNSMDNLKFPPFIKIAVTDADGKSGKNYNTIKYNLNAIGTWQKLSVEFELISTGRKGIMAVEKGTTQSLSPDLYIKQLSLTKVKGVAKLEAPALINNSGEIQESTSVAYETLFSSSVGGGALSKTSLAVNMDSIPAFPGAEGFGAMSKGGRGGKIIEVTNLNASGPGSFRQACYTKGPRIVVFKIGGTITINDRLVIREPYITIAGQTAPGDGICLRGGTLAIATHDVVVRYLKIRVGDDINGPNPENRDAIDIGGSQENPAKDIIFDHCSFSWAIDENVSTWFYNQNITFQWCIISEGLQYSLHPSGPHSKGMILGSKDSTTTVHHCLFAHNWDRNPLMGNEESELIENPSIFDIRYNIIYNHGLYACSKVIGKSHVNYVGNNIKMGQDGSSNEIKGLAYTGFEGQLLYAKDNIWPLMSSTEGDHSKVLGYALGKNWKNVPSNLITQQPFEVPVITDLLDNYNAVLKYVGAVIPKRDSVDERIINDVKNKTGKIINSQKEVGGWPIYKNGTPLLDNDHDGMPDFWEIEYGLNKDDSKDGYMDYDSDGFTNVEEYLNNIAPSMSNN